MNHRLFSFAIAIVFGYGKIQSQGLGGFLKKEEGNVNKEVKKEEKQLKMGDSTSSAPKAPTESEIIQGLKEALNSGTSHAANQVSQSGGYLNNARIFIPFPPEAQEMKARLVEFGMGDKVKEFETSLNSAAEEAAKGAVPVFAGSIKNMTVTDGMSILKGSDTAATHYLKKTTHQELYTQYKPTVKNAIAKVKVTQYWDPLVTHYNRIPGVKKQNPDLEDYITNRALSGLYLLVADEEAKIRKNPMQQVSDILKKVFGWAASQSGH